MRTLLLVGVTALLLDLLPSSLQGQILPVPGERRGEVVVPQGMETRLFAGVTLGGSLGSYSRGIPMIYTPICNRLEDGGGLGYSVGVAAEYILSRSLSLRAHGRYAAHPASFAREETVGSTRLEEGVSGTVVVRIDSRIDYDAVEADLLLSWMPAVIGGTRVGGAIGPWIGVPVAGTMSQEHAMEIYSVEGAIVMTRDNSYRGEVWRKTLADQEEITRMRSLQYGLRAGLQLEHRIARGVYITPGLYADLPLTTFTDYPWGSLTSYNLSVDLTVGL